MYYFNDKANKIFISNVADKKIVKIIQIPDTFQNPSFFVDKKTLSIVASGYSRGDSKTYVAIYTIQEKNTFVFSKIYTVEGYLENSRKIGDKIYLISNFQPSIPYHEEDEKFDISSYIPKKIEFLLSKNSKNPYEISARKTASCNSIEYSLPNEETLKKFDFNFGFIVVSIIDTANLKNRVKTHVVAGSNTEIHMSLKNLYLVEPLYSGSDYLCGPMMDCIFPRYEKGTNTIIHKMNITDDAVKYQTSNLVAGSPLTQYSMDEHDDYFRILTQTDTWGLRKNKKHTNLFILDKDLKLTGKLTNLGSGENFKSSRYMGDKLFLVTFRNVDPFFVIDVKNPKEPKVLGELKIPGYSTYLHPYDENHIIGLGYNASDNGHGGVYNDGLKIDLYEINYNKKCGDKNLSDEENKKCKKGDYKGIIAKQQQTLTLGESGSESEALENPRMFMWNANKKILLLPVELQKNVPGERYQPIDYFAGMKAFTITPEKIEELYEISHIDTKNLHKKRVKACEPFLKHTNKKQCVKLLNGEEYCGVRNQRRVPEYCFADATDGVYFAENRWNYRDNAIKRAIWVGDEVFTLSDALFSVHNLENGKFLYGQSFNSLSSLDFIHSKTPKK